MIDGVFIGILLFLLFVWLIKDIVPFMVDREKGKESNNVKTLESMVLLDSEPLTLRKVAEKPIEIEEIIDREKRDKEFRYQKILSDELKYHRKNSIGDKLDVIADNIRWGNIPRILEEYDLSLRYEYGDNILSKDGEKKRIHLEKDSYDGYTTMLDNGVRVLRNRCIKDKGFVYTEVVERHPKLKKRYVDFVEEVYEKVLLVVATEKAKELHDAYEKLANNPL